MQIKTGSSEPVFYGFIKFCVTLSSAISAFISRSSFLFYHHYLFISCIVINGYPYSCPSSCYPLMSTVARDPFPGYIILSLTVSLPMSLSPDISSLSVAVVPVTCYPCNFPCCHNVVSSAFGS